MSDITIPGGKIRSFVERIENLDSEMQELSEQKKEVFAEAKGEGFDVNNVPDPRDPQNLLKTSGRGVLFIYNIMDEVKYNERGNRLTMIKRGEPNVG